MAQLFGKEAALFVPTGTMGNLICGKVFAFQLEHTLFILLKIIGVTLNMTCTPHEFNLVSTAHDFGSAFASGLFVCLLFIFMPSIGEGHIALQMSSVCLSVDRPYFVQSVTENVFLTSRFNSVDCTL